MFRVEARGPFLQGLTQPSVLSVSVAVAVAAIVFAVCFLFVTPALLATGTIGYVASNAYDYDAFVTSRIFALQRSHDTRPLVAILGASVTRVSFGAEREIEDALRAQTGVDAEVAILCTGRQNFLENAAIVDALPPDRPTLFVVGIAPGRFAWTPGALGKSHTDPRLGFRSAATDREAPALGLAPFESHGSYFLDNKGFLLPRMKYLLRSAVQGPVPILENRYTDARQAPKEFDARNRAVVARFDRYEANFDVNAAVLGRLVEAVRSRANARVFFVEEAVNPAFLRDYLDPAFYDRYVDRISKLAKELNVPYWQIYRTANVGEGEFYDWAHVSDLGARARMRTVLAENLAPYLQ